MDKSTRPSKIKCPSCGSTRIGALVLHDVTRYSDHIVRGVLNGKLVLGARKLQVWDKTHEESLDRDLKCRACDREIGIDEVGIDEADKYTYEERRADERQQGSDDDSAVA